MKPSRYLSAFFIIASCSWPVAAQTSAFCRNDAPPGGVVLEVSLMGRGMVTPGSEPQTFFRLHENGLVEYEARTRTRYVEKRGKLNARQVAEIRSFIQSPDFVNARDKYPLLKDLRDATLWTCVSSNAGGKSKRILITNYMPGHAAAKGYYPESLMRLLQMVSEVRRQTKFELEYSLGSVGLP